MNFYYNKNLINYAKQQRREMTRQERRFWFDFCKNYNVKIVRQKVIGNYILDFYCASAKIAIEIDGSQHYEEEQIKYDEKRSEYLKSLGIEIIRYTNLDIDRNFENVCLDIHTKITKKGENKNGKIYHSR